jgi:hypothetical protein
MASSIPARSGGASNTQRALPRAGRHARPVYPSANPLFDPAREGLERIGAARRALNEAHARLRLRLKGSDSDVVNSAFTTAQEILTEAHEIVSWSRRELILVRDEFETLDRLIRRQDRFPIFAPPVVPDTPDLDLCPDPSSARTAADLMGALRGYRTWAGQPSYRFMAGIIKNQGGQPYASSTLHAALTRNELPAFPLVKAILTACGASEAHHQMFASAWRRIVMSQQDAITQPSDTEE